MDTTESADDIVRSISELKARKRSLEDSIRKDKNRLADSDLKFRDVKNQVKLLRAELKQSNAECQALTDLKEDELETMKQLQSLMSKNETLKRKEAEFKANCKEEREALLGRNQAVRDHLKSLDDLASREETSAKESKLAALKIDLAQKSNKVSELESQLDKVPSSYELNQYQKRFVELDSELAAEFSATQRYFVMYNTLLDQRGFTQKSIDILESVLDSIPDPKYSSSTVKAQFVEKLSNLQQNLDNAKSNYQSILSSQEAKKTGAEAELSKLLELQRAYGSLVKEMRDEMKKHERLTLKIQESTSRNQT